MKKKGLLTHFPRDRQIWVRHSDTNHSLVNYEKQVHVRNETLGYLAEIYRIKPNGMLSVIRDVDSVVSIYFFWNKKKIHANKHRLTNKHTQNQIITDGNSIGMSTKHTLLLVNNRSQTIASCKRNS